MEKQEEVQEEGELVAVSARALWKKSWKRREEEEEEDGFRSLSLFFHFGPLFFAPLSPLVISLSLSLSTPSACFFHSCRFTGANYLSVNVLLRLFNPREGPRGGSTAQR